MARPKLSTLATVFAFSVMCWLTFKFKICNTYHNHDKEYFSETMQQENKPLHLDRIEISNIIFLETSGRKVLTSRDACAVESAALHNPYIKVNLFSTQRIASKDIFRMALKNISNVKIEFLDTEALFSGTPLQDWYASGILTKSSFPIQHLSDAARLAYLWKGGGIYLDTDMISIRPFDNFYNAFGMASGKADNSVLAFQKTHPFLLRCMEDFAKNYNAYAYDHHGPALVTRVLEKFCGVYDGLCQVINSPEKCHGVRLLPEHTFFVFPWFEWRKLFEKADRVDISLSYTVHMYSKMSRDTWGKPGDGSLLDVLSKTNCPVTYQLMTKKHKL